MTKWKGLDVKAEGTGISRPLSEQVNLLGELLGQAIREQSGQNLFELVEELRRLCKRAVQERRPALRARAAKKISGLKLPQIEALLRAYTAFFHLVNQAEQQEIVRINRERELKSSASKPRAESIAAAIHQLKKKGHSLEAVRNLVERLDIQSTFTAHPTEARRRTVLNQQQRIAQKLTERRRTKQTPAENEQSLEEIRNQISVLLATDPIHTERPTVDDEVENGLYFFSNAVWETVPQIYTDMRRALTTHYGSAPPLPVFLRFRSWIGSDRDGNPNVTPEVTRRTVHAHRHTAINLLLNELRKLHRELSLSDRFTRPPKSLTDSIARDAKQFSLPGGLERRLKREPYRIKLSYMMMHLENLLLDPKADQSKQYRSSDLLKDLELIEQGLVSSGFADLARNGRLTRVIDLARTFGFHLASLDVRQHSRVHEEVISHLLNAAGVEDSYGELPENKRISILTRELANRRPLLPRRSKLPDPVREVMETFEVIREALEADPDAIGSYIVSMTHEVSDLLEVMVIAKESGLWKIRNGKVSCPFDIVPLFETIDDLNQSGSFMDDFFGHGIYRKQVAARGDFQEIMLGYSDSNKDGGYWMSNWALHTSQAELGRVCQKHNIDFRLFHGRGGTVGRGGGRAGQAILAMPGEALNGRIRFTEQGEVISFRYALPDIARRHLEQITNASLLATAQTGSDRKSPGDREIMDQIASRSMAAYRELTDDPGFWNWYTQVTPIEHISRLPIASRPVSRKAASEVDLEGLRAIPWVFAWTQTRYIAPGWYGIGRALAETVSDDPSALKTLRRLYKSWSFFRAVVNNAQREMARSRLEMSKHYASLSGNNEIDKRLNRDFADARKTLLAITRQKELLDNTPVIRKSISLRNPYTDVLNLLQIELMKRYRKSKKRDPLRQALFLSINGIAAAMQSTG